MSALAEFAHIPSGEPGPLAPPAPPLVTVVPDAGPPRHAWFPTSPCTDRCHLDGSAMVGRLVVVGRIVRLCVVAMSVLVVGVAVAGLPRLVRRAYLRRSALAMLRALGLRVVVDDRRPFASNARGLVVANHVSYLDILAVAVISPAHFVAKSEVCAIPGIATLARRLGVIPVERGSLRKLPKAVGDATRGLNRDCSVAVFPEGTTWCGRAGGAFAPAFFQAAIDAGVPVIPIGLTFQVAGSLATAPGFFGDDGLGDTLGRVVRARGLSVTIAVHEAQLPNTDRRELAARCQHMIGFRGGHINIYDV